MEQGFTAVKFDPAGPYTAYSGHQLSLDVLDRCETFCRKIREAVGNRCDLLFGTHGQMVPSSAIRLAKRLEKYDPLWFEEPVPPGQEEAMAQVAAKTTIPIATGERLTTKYEFFKLLQAGGASILQMNVGRCGGLLEAKKIASMAEAYYAQIAPHLYNGPIGAAASFQLADMHAEFPDPGKHRHLGWLPRRSAEEAAAMGRWLHHSVEGAGLGCRAEHGSGAQALTIHGRAAASADGCHTR